MSTVIFGLVPTDCSYVSSSWVRPSTGQLSRAGWTNRIETRLRRCNGRPPGLLDMSRGCLLAMVEKVVDGFVVSDAV